jgi:penicillin-binding protein 1A
VWIGFDNKRPIGNKETGGRVAAPIWKSFMELALAGVPPAEFVIPEGLKCVNVDPATGARAAPGGASRLECFRPGTEPQRGAVPVQLVEHQQQEQPSTLDFMRSDF